MSAQSLVGETPTWDGSTYELISRERSYHDEAGRQNRSETLRENGTTPTYTETRSILLPGGHVWKSYAQTVGSGVRVLETSRDSLDGVTAQEDKIGTSPQAVSASVTTYSPTTGRVDKTTRIEWDEAESTTYDYETEYTYDARGRVTNTLDKGQTVPALTPPPVAIERRVAYDGLGRQTYSATVQGTTEGLVTIRTLDLGGQELEEKRGRGPEPFALYQKSTSAYDRKSRMLSRTERDQTVTPVGSRVTTYAYDGADRQVSVTLPPYTTGGTARTVSTSYDILTGGKEEMQTTDPNGVPCIVTSNQKGQPLVETVTVPTGVTHVTGATEVSYLYADSSGCGCSASGKAVRGRSMRARHHPGYHQPLECFWQPTAS
ncbi:MAG: hypothetical protein AB7O52_05215 [Planctomycetota bacterium]